MAMAIALALESSGMRESGWGVLVVMALGGEQSVDDE
jgi:hypothetical protein